jgi:tetratricopeptide (TPR) repeat protein
MGETRLTQPESGKDSSHVGYVVESRRGQQLLDENCVAQATQVFEGILARLGPKTTYERAVILGRLGRCLHLSGQPDAAFVCLREAMDVVGRLVPSAEVKRLRGTLRSELGDALRAGGKYDDAKRAYEAALKIAEELNDLRGQGIELGRLGALASAEGKLEEALTREQAALRLFQQLGEADLEAAAWHQLGRIYHQQAQGEEAERHYREAARISEARGHMAAAAQTRSILADLLQNQPGRLVEARQLAEKALTVAQSFNPTGAATWRIYGVRSDIAAKEARISGDREQTAALEVQARNYHEVHHHAPVICAALARLETFGDPPRYARAVILGQLGRSFHM